MTRKGKRHRPFISLLLALTLAAAVPPPRADAVERPAASKLANGYLLIGTFLVHKDALTKPVLDAAKASMEESGQGMFYKSELADGAWCNIKNGTDIKAILKGEGVVVPDAEVDKMKVNVWVSMENGAQTFTPLLTAAELDQKIQKLQDRIKAAEEENKQALKAQDDLAAAATGMKIAALQAESDFWEALQSGDSSKAGEGLEKQTNPEKLLDGLPKTSDEVVAAAKQDSDKVLAALEAAVHRSAAQEVTDQLAKLEEADAKVEGARTSALEQKQAGLTTEKDKLAASLQDKQDRKRDLLEQNVALQAILNAANKVGEKEIAADLMLKIAENASRLPALRDAEKQTRVALLKQEQSELAGQPGPLAHVEALLRSEEQGIAQKIADLEEARYKLMLEIEQAVASGLEEDLRAVEQNLTKTQQEQLILEKQLTEEKPPSPELNRHRSEVIRQILALEKKKYTSGELTALDAVRTQIAAALGKRGQVLPVENVYSKDVEIKFQVPTVVIEGRAFIHIRPISEAFGSTVIWSDAEQSVTINRGDTLVHCRIGDEAAYINGRKVKLDTAPRLIAQRTFVPLRFVMDALGLDVEWDEATQSIEIKGIVN